LKEKSRELDSVLVIGLDNRIKDTDQWIIETELLLNPPTKQEQLTQQIIDRYPMYADPIYLRNRVPTTRTVEAAWDILSGPGDYTTAGKNWRCARCTNSYGTVHQPTQQVLCCECGNLDIYTPTYNKQVVAAAKLPRIHRYG
jgi:hypothetical protein